MATLDINEGLRIYLGSDESGGVRPYGMEARIHERYGVEAAAVEREIRAVLASVGDVPEAQRFDGPAAIALLIADRARVMRFRLADDVCKAIGNYVAYSYR
jgi:hypothetical protein